MGQPFTNNSFEDKKIECLQAEISLLQQNIKHLEQQLSEIQQSCRHVFKESYVMRKCVKCHFAESKYY
ncbi:hypothetical protein WAK64_07145 [Bacillus spongiae]|uniref:Serine protease n=1 Tax=Bacillus spongiae TaxID=2683610 RepID=A0ABU8HBX6_9BACI